VQAIFSSVRQAGGNLRSGNRRANDEAGRGNSAQFGDCLGLPKPADEITGPPTPEPEPPPVTGARGRTG